MFLKTWFWIKRLFKRIQSVFTLSRSNPSLSDSQVSIDIINDKIKLLTGTSQNSINLLAYQRYFDFCEKLGLKEEFSVITTQDKLVLYGIRISPVLKNGNNQKLIIFCHGLTNNRWSLFYVMHLALQRGYQVLAYDARNHGASQKSYTSLGQVEASDLQDIISWARKKSRPTKIGLCGFSMGSSTLLFWIAYFGGVENPEVVMAICEASFDKFSTQFEQALGSGFNYYWKEFLANKLIHESLRATQSQLEKINPLLDLPHRLPVKLLLLHGLDDEVIDWRATFRLYHQLNKNKLNQGQVSLYFCKDADHGEFSFVGDYVPNSLRWKSRTRQSVHTFSSLFFNYLEKNL
ncbi:MAG: alpha/beta fold hydrolase [Candidatus Moeniiplasma glomeromycotorum]|nr:alpha/beta fold hydrolase [Candidatus Moeniiplasma glomeromycotorum]MCE8167488.1 alpha/beta fold hydrolase [Candidatus Moeniiplasma glomeromycotorum]